MKLKELIAKNYNDKTISLYDHSIQVADKSVELFDMLGIKDEELRWLCYITALLHDIGKCSKDFQKYIIGETNDYVYHNVLGSFIVKHLLDFNGTIDAEKLVNRVIMYHHPVNNKSEQDLEKINLEDEYYLDIINEYIDIINKKYLSFNRDIRIKPLYDTVIPSLNDVKYYDSEINSRFNEKLYILTNIIKFADSQHNVEELVKRKNKIVVADINKPIDYDERFYLQSDYADKLSQKNISAFESETGFGKTMLGLLYGLKSSDRKIYWVCPRNSIAEGIFNTLTNELNKLNLSNKISIGLLLTNDWKKGNKKSDIIVTNIDNFLRPVIKNDALDRSYDMLFSTVIFDEFHEYVMTSSLMAFFDIMLKSRFMTNSKTLCLSATPIMKLFPKSIRDTNLITHVDKTISERIYNVSFFDNINALPTIDRGYMISVNATKTAQNRVLSSNANKTLHSRFFHSDIEAHLFNMINEYGKKNKEGKKTTTWAVTNIISTGVDISFNNIVINAPIPNRFIQIIGRCNRWSDNNQHSIIFTPLSVAEHSEQEALKKQGLKDFSNILYKELKKLVNGKQEIKFKELYNINRKFVNSKEFDTYINKMKKKSYQNLEKNIFYDFAENIDNDDIILGSNKLREDDSSIYNFFVKLKDSQGNWITELYEGNNMIFNFRQLFYNKSNKQKNFERKLIKEVKDNKNYFKHRKCTDNETEIIDKLMIKARKKSSPFPMIDYWHYDSKLGVVKN